MTDQEETEFPRVSSAGAESDTATLHEHTSSTPSSSKGQESPEELKKRATSDEERKRIDDLVRKEDEEFAEYGGDDPRDPPPKSNEGSEEKEMKTQEEKDKEEEEKYMVEWDGEDDKNNPQNWSTRYKVVITAIACLLTLNVTFASSAPSSAVELIARDLGVGMEAATLGSTSMFLAGYCVGPLVWAPVSEMIGRRPIFIFSLLVYVIFQLGPALGQNIATLIVTRFLGGTFASAPLANSGGVIADIWDPIGRGPAMSIFSASVFIGPVMGPIVGGFVSQSYLGWRWVFWLMMIFAGFTLFVAYFFLPETYGPVLLEKKAKALRKADPENNAKVYASHEKADWSVMGVLHRTLFRPFQMLAVEPILLLVTIYLSIVYGLLYAMFSILPLLYEQLRGFNLGQTGLTFIPIGIGTSIGAIANILMQRHYRTLTPKWHGHPPPENRLFGSMLAGPCLIIGIMWMGWSGAYASVPWYVPALGSIVLGTSFSLVFISFLTYLVDVYLMYSASALAANTIVRSAVGAAFPLFVDQMFKGMRIQWASTLIGGIALLLAPSPYIFYKYGAQLRQRSTFAPCIDLKIREQVEREEREAKGDKSEVV